MCEHNFATRAVHAGAAPDPRTGAVINPISLSTTFAQVGPAQPVGDFEYSRSDNPNRRQFEEAVAALELGSEGLAFASGSAATASVLQALATPGPSHVVSIGDVYGGTHRYLTKVAKAHGVEVSFTSDVARDLPGLVRPETRLVWIETPSNPTLGVTDIAKVAEQVREIREKTGQSLYLLVDNTFMSPYIQQPLLHGADLVLHSVSKYLNGHSDVVMGLVVVSNKVDPTVAQRVRFMQNAIGAVPSPFDCWLAHRGLKTLHVRLEAASRNALAIATALEAQIGKDVVSVSYPGLASHPGNAIVQRQHTRGLGGGMVAVRIAGTLENAAEFCKALKLFTFAESLGGIESLCEVPAAMTHAGIPRAEREASGVYDNLVRLSVGIEDREDLVKDVTQALGAAAAFQPSK